MSNKHDMATIVVAVLVCLAISAISIGVYKLFLPAKGSECAIEVQFQDSRATYIGTIV